MPAGLTVDTVGPVDVAVFAFEGNKFNGEVAPALLDLQDSGTIRVLDATFVSKDAEGTVSLVEVADSAVASAFERVTGESFDLLSDEDLDVVAAGLDADSSALVVVWENTWAAPLASAIRGSKGRVVFLERIPRDEVAAAITALEKE